MLAEEKSKLRALESVNETTFSNMPTVDVLGKVARDTWQERRGHVASKVVGARRYQFAQCFPDWSVHTQHCEFPGVTQSPVFSGSTETVLSSPCLVMTGLT